MGLLKGLFRTVTSPIEATARATKEVFSRDNDTDGTDCADILTGGVTRVAQGGIRGISDTFKAISDEFDD